MNQSILTVYHCFLLNEFLPCFLQVDFMPPCVWQNLAWWKIYNRQVNFGWLDFYKLQNKVLWQKVCIIYFEFNPNVSNGCASHWTPLSLQKEVLNRYEHPRFRTLLIAQTFSSADWTIFCRDKFLQMNHFFGINVRKWPKLYKICKKFCPWK